jgi:hypothetical protein
MREFWIATTPLITGFEHTSIAIASSQDVPLAGRICQFANDRLAAVMRHRFGSIAAIFLLFALPAGACSCAGVVIGGCNAPTADMIALATVVSKDLITDGPVSDGPNPNGQLSRRPASRVPSDARRPAPVVRITLSLSERFRGDFGNSVVVQTDTSDCAYPFETGHQYLVFANQFQGNLP